MLVLATQNKKKRQELEQLTAGRYAVRTLDELGLADLVIDESAATFAGNARIKAEAVLAALSAQQRADTFAVLADDSGISVDALDGKPGVRSARFAADHGVSFLGPTADAANNALLLTLLQIVPPAKRTARFASAVCAVVVATGQVLEAFGTVEGSIACDLVGAGGFGYDPLFVPDEAPGKRMAELNSDEKNAISHRGRAMRALFTKL
ncbi:MAG TPA: non-canonical purine NTP pyrophosphatase [Myxococcota bacterium]